MLIQAQKGWFLARVANGVATVEPAGTADTGYVSAMLDLPGAGVLIQAYKGWFLATREPLSGARVAVRDRTALDGSSPELTRELNVVFTMAHACARVADKLDLRLRVEAPGHTPGALVDVQLVNPSAAHAEVAVPLRIAAAGVWSFQLVSTLGGYEQPVGELQRLFFKEPEDLRSWLERWAWWLGAGFALLLALVNAALFVLARRSAWAWEVATDDGMGTRVLRIATLALSHVQKAQIWILDLYFRRRRAKTPAAAPFLPLPLTSGNGALDASDKALAPPWTGKRLWVQGSSGMGKTALLVTEAHFRDHQMAFSAFAKWGCVVVAFAARDFAGSGEDKDDPAWVVDAVRATLSSQGVTFADEKLLSRFLESGSIGVAIDGLNEVNRTLAVAAFTRKFEAAPMLVTSQQSGDQRDFTTWHLPADIRAFTEDLLREYLGEDYSAAVMTRISACGLKDAIRSGYDVRLIIDLARPDPLHAPLPADRLGLYAAVIAAGWLEVPQEVQREQLNRTSAAAWRMVSERKAK